jgi:hypothetical protein
MGRNGENMGLCGQNGGRGIGGTFTIRVEEHRAALARALYFSMLSSRGENTKDVQPTLEDGIQVLLSLHTIVYAGSNTFPTS